MRKLTDSEKFDILINGVLKELYKRDFPFRLTFDIPGTNNAAIMIVIPDALNKVDFSFQIGVHRQGYDLLVSHFWKSGSTEEVKEYLKKALEDEEELKKIRKALEDLSASVDYKMD